MEPDSDRAPEELRSEKPRTLGAAVRALSPWKKLTFALALLMAVAGLVAGGPSSRAPSSASPAPEGSSAFLPGSGSTPAGAGDSQAAEPPSTLEKWSPAMVKVGFGFAAGLALGLFLRNFIRLTLTFAGLVLLVILGLEYLGYVTVEWQAMRDSFDALGSSLGRDLSGFKTFVEGRIPAAGTALVGFWAGFRRG